MGQGSGTLGAPDLTEIGQTNDAAYFVDYLANPAAFGNTVMGSYSYLGQENLEALGAFLEASKGGGRRRAGHARPLQKAASSPVAVADTHWAGQCPARHLGTTVTLPPMRVFLGVTGASGAPYAERLLRALAAAECEVGVCASRSGIEVLATELYRDPSLERDEVLSALVGDAAGVTVYGESDFGSPYASGSAKVDAYVICPCSMATVGTLASGAMQNLVPGRLGRAQGAPEALLVPRETPPRPFTCAGSRR